MRLFAGLLQLPTEIPKMIIDTVNKRRAYLKNNAAALERKDKYCHNSIEKQAGIHDDILRIWWLSREDMLSFLLSTGR
jgi:hypothetical protein